MKLLALLVTSSLWASSALQLRKASETSQLSLEADATLPPSYVYQSPECCFYADTNGGGDKWCIRSDASGASYMNDRASSVGTAAACTTTLYEDSNYGGKTLYFGGGSWISSLEPYTLQSAEWYNLWRRTSWEDQMGSARCSCTTCTPPCLDCVNGKPTECKACEFGYNLQNSTCVPEMGVGYKSPAPNGLNAVDVCVNANFTNCVSTRSDASLIGERYGPTISSIRTTESCNATVWTGRDFSGSRIDVPPSTKIVFDNSTKGKIMSIKTNCLSCGEQCSECRKDLEDPNFCTVCRDSNTKLDGGKCYTNVGDECCFFQNANLTGYRTCTKENSAWVGYDFADKVKFARVDAGCSLKTYQLVNYGGIMNTWSAAASSVQPIGSAFRSYQCYCGAPTDAPAVTTLPPPRLPAVNSTVAGYTALGCYTPQEGVLSDPAYTRNMGGLADPAGWCATFCYDRGNDFFGLANGDECRCGNVKDVSVGKVADTECSVTCKGAPYVTCGSDTRVNVFKITNAPSPQLVAAKQESDKTKPLDIENTDPMIAQPDAAAKVYTYLGCFYENPADTGLPEINDNPLETTDMTPAKCATNCNGYDLFSLRTNLCVCSKRSTWTGQYGRAEEALCQPCVNDKLSKCGSMRHNSVYRMFV
eukprot:GDKI01043547.1.p1 GENE.GDKI01043547.1~~GDKI01043547.1.p1  ORF type:complete len:646 (-),score=208.63 GDKI01043547.1:502-2439(-)